MAPPNHHNNSDTVAIRSQNDTDRIGKSFESFSQVLAHQNQQKKAGLVMKMALLLNLLAEGLKSRFFIAILPLVAVLLLGAWIIARINRWRKEPDGELRSTSDLMSEYRRMHEGGELSDEEFEKIRSRLGEQLRQEIEEQAPEKPNGSHPTQTESTDSSST